MNNKGFSALLTILILSLFVTAGVLYYRGYSTIEDQENVSETKKTEEKIRNAVSQRVFEFEDSNNELGTNFKIINATSKYVRGEVKINDVVQDVYLVAIEDEWVVVELTEDTISCEKAERMGFPANMVYDCLYEHPKAEPVLQVLYDIENGLISSDQIEIIGTVNLSDDPNSEEFEIISDDGESIIIKIDDLDDETEANLVQDNYIVVNVSVETDEEGEVVLTLESTEEIETLDDLEPVNDSSTETDSSEDSSIDEESDSNTDQNTNEQTTDQNDDVILNTDSNSDDVSSDIISDEPQPEEYDITNLSPDTSNTSSDFFESLIDRDNSGLNVKIISDF